MRTISAEGCAGTGQIALSPAFRALDTHDLRGWCGHRTNRTLACISRTRHARSPQRVARAWDKSHSRLHFAHSTRAISAEGCARMGQIALSPAFRTLDTHDLRRELRVKSPKRAFRTRLPPKVKRKHPSEHTHHAALPSSFALPAPPNNIRSHANPNVTATFTSTTTHNLTIPCACHESFRVHTSNAHKVLRLPRNVPAPATQKSPFQLRVVTKTELQRHTLKRKSQWHGHIQHPKNTTLQTLIPMELRSNLRISQNAAPVQRNASRFLQITME